MAKEKSRGNREAKKPKASKKPAAPATSPFSTVTPPPPKTARKPS